MALVTVNDMIAKAIDTRDAKLAGRIADRLRAEGENYDAILARALAVRPDFTSAEWESLMYDADSEET
jgi:hypothetical protein